MTPGATVTNIVVSLSSMQLHLSSSGIAMHAHSSINPQAIALIPTLIMCMHAMVSIVCYRSQGLSQVWRLVRLPAPLYRLYILEYFQASLLHHSRHCLLTQHETYMQKQATRQYTITRSVSSIALTHIYSQIEEQVNSFAEKSK